MNRFEREQEASVKKLQAKLKRLYGDAIRAFSGLSVGVDFDANRVFSFDDYPAIKRRAERLIDAFRADVEVAVVNGIEASWSIANNKNNELSRRVLGANVGALSQADYRKYFSTNDKAREAFVKRKDNGLGLSDRVWHYSQQYKQEIELGLDVGLRNGLGAAEMARDLKQYLKNPDMLFRRVRDVHGNLQLSEKAKAFKPGQGVYRSSYKNAMRLCRTETNMAYQTADFERWQKLDFVVGIEINLSNNHPVEDVCDELRGKYPKDFLFRGWHPQCRCHAVPLLNSNKEFLEKKKGSVNEVKDVPMKFKEWVREREEKIKNGGNVPYYIRDNKKFVDNALGVKELSKGNKEGIETLMKRYNGIDFVKIEGIKNGGVLEIFTSGRQNPQEFEKNKKTLMILANKGEKYRMLPVLNDGNKNPDALNLKTFELTDIKVTETTNGKNLVQSALKEASKQGANEVIIRLTKQPDSYKSMYAALKLTLEQDRAKIINVATVIYPNNSMKRYNISKLRTKIRKG